MLAEKDETAEVAKGEGMDVIGEMKSGAVVVIGKLAVAVAAQIGPESILLFQLSSGRKAQHKLIGGHDLWLVDWLTG